MLNLTIFHTDGQITQTTAAWFTTTYAYDLKSADQENNDAHDVVGIAAIEKGDINAIEFTSPALYLHPWHGRNAPDEQLHDWGFDGPMIGPLAKVRFEAGDYSQRIDPSFTITRPDGSTETFTYTEALGVYNQHYFGDWSVIEATPEQAAKSQESYRLLCATT